jgi:hypothetical protein
VSPVKYGLGSYIPEDDILHSDRRENLKSYRLSLVLIPPPRAQGEDHCLHAEGAVAFQVPCSGAMLLRSKLSP